MSGTALQSCDLATRRVFRDEAVSWRMLAQLGPSGLARLDDRIVLRALTGVETAEELRSSAFNGLTEDVTRAWTTRYGAVRHLAVLDCLDRFRDASWRSDGRMAEVATQLVRNVTEIEATGTDGSTARSSAPWAGSSSSSRALASSTPSSASVCADPTCSTIR